MEPIWGFDKAAAMAAGATTDNIGEFAHVGTRGVLSAILATFAIAPWAYVGFDTIPQAAEEYNFSYKKVMGITAEQIMAVAEDSLGHLSRLVYGK
jgi:amino acid transporter